MVYNAPFCYPDHHPTSRSKRYSTDSLTESTSPHNEETSQDLSQSGGETANNVDFNPAFTAAYPGLYCNGGGGLPGSTEADDATTEPRKIKKKRRRKLSKPIPDGGTSSDEYSESEEPVSEIENRIIQGTHRTSTSTEAEADVTASIDEKPVDVSKTSLKPDAKEFVPMAYRVEQTPFPFIPPNFFFINELPPGFNPTCLPPGIPINFVHPDHKSNYVNAIPNHPHHHQHLQQHSPVLKQLESTAEESKDLAQEEILPEVEKKPEEEPKPVTFPKRDIDIEVIVSKLEEAAKEQRRKLSPKFKPKPKRTYVKKPVEELPRDDEATTKMQYSDVSAKKSSAPLKDVKPNVNVTIKSAVQQSPKRNPLPESPKSKPNPNQWISVSNKKKRKNKAQEVDNFSGQEEEEVAPVAEDGFESYDVTKLVDVVPAKPDNIIQVPEKVDVKPIPLVPREIVIQDVQVIEKAMIEQCQKKPSENQEIDMLIESLAEIESKIKPKALVVKQKKKVIVTDVDLSESVEEPKKVPKIAKKVVVKKEIEEKPIAESPEKKKVNKKKKKSSRDSQIVQNLDDYDFLIKDSLLVEEKTNVEVSEELDKIIQRGMYSSLEEKIRSLNIKASNDGFFKTMSLLGPERKKSNDLTEALMKTTSFKPAVASTRDAVKVTSTELTTPPPSPSSSTTTGSFLDLARDSSVVAAAAAADDDKEEKDETHPITQAVKDWMTRTRETTPDVEIFKSPREILQNFASDEVTLWTFSPQSSIDDDLLDCWEDDVTVIENNKKNPNTDDCPRGLRNTANRQP
ncbi:PREDICTED: uncharacterized protein LOC108561148 [Nicrophorus vespilloides]|uniref:Uncharacterized protein LOC108561148 n=1 Tax=Nicrophorus vespilloides TaxID=110193 RepID=A0ABM1MIQ1_NICVS|nr:PREDICTED: uncharacterized protein LOC108561148 [Nicrophorus vespilloides]